MWWGTMGLMLIEGTVFALAVMMYFYLRRACRAWPLGAAPPDLRWGTLNTVVLLASACAEPAGQARGRTRRPATGAHLARCLPAVRAWRSSWCACFEFTALNMSWDTNAYGSVVWLLLGLHTTHLVTDAFDTAVLTVLMFTGPLEGKRFVDVSENALYWYFVVLSWLPIYAVIYWVPRY